MKILLKILSLPILALALLTISKATYSPKVEYLKVNIKKSYRSNSSKLWGSYHLENEKYQLIKDKDITHFENENKLEKLIFKDKKIFFVHVLNKGLKSEVQIEEFPYVKKGNEYILSLNSKTSEKKEIYNSLLKKQIQGELKQDIKSYGLQSGNCRKEKRSFTCELNFKIYI